MLTQHIEVVTKWPRNGIQTRADVLAAARHRFRAEGYDRITLRANAQTSAWMLPVDRLTLVSQIRRHMRVSNLCAGITVNADDPS